MKTPLSVVTVRPCTTYPLGTANTMQPWFGTPHALRPFSTDSALSPRHLLSDDFLRKESVDCDGPPEGRESVFCADRNCVLVSSQLDTQWETFDTSGTRVRTPLVSQTKYRFLSLRYSATGKELWRLVWLQVMKIACDPVPEKPEHWAVCGVQ